DQTEEGAHALTLFRNRYTCHDADHQPFVDHQAHLWAQHHVHVASLHFFVHLQTHKIAGIGYHVVRTGIDLVTGFEAAVAEVVEQPRAGINKRVKVTPPLLGRHDKRIEQNPLEHIIAAEPVEVG